jgi:hypothetical protein
MFCQKSITAKTVERGSDDIPPVKYNQKNLRQNIETAFDEPVFPLVWFESAVEKAYGHRRPFVSNAGDFRRHHVDCALFDACRVWRLRRRKKSGQWQRAAGRNCLSDHQSSGGRGCARGAVAR